MPESPPASDHETAVNAEVPPDPPFSLAQLWQLISLPVRSQTASSEKLAPEQPPKRNEKIVILGKEYDVDGINSDVEADIYSKIWLTYRAGFEPIPKCEDGPQPLSFIHSMLFNKNPLANGIGDFRSLFNNDEFTTDVGWGCMIRTSQSLLANTYQTLLLGKLFRFHPDQPNSGETTPEHTKPDHTTPEQTTNALHNHIIDLFHDNYNSPFSLHNFIRVASELPLQVKPGQWFGPNAASLSIKRLCDRIDLAKYPSIPRLLVLVSESSDLYDDEIRTILDGGSALLMLLPVRLGIDKINKLYHPSLMKLLSLKQSVGIAGGKPSSSFYFFGCREPDELLYLDPHFPQVITDNEYGSFHTKRYQKLNISDLDPSMLIGLLLQDVDDYEDLKSSLIQGPSKIIHFHDKNGLIRSAPSSRQSVATPRRRNSKFVSIESEDCQEEFTMIVNKKEDGFVDVGDELGDELGDGQLQSYENSPEPELTTSNPSVTDQASDFVHVDDSVASPAASPST